VNGVTALVASAFAGLVSGLVVGGLLRAFKGS
jgi:hypothetical protein